MAVRNGVLRCVDLLVSRANHSTTLWSNWGTEDFAEQKVDRNSAKGITKDVAQCNGYDQLNNAPAQGCGRVTLGSRRESKTAIDNENTY